MHESCTIVTATATPNDWFNVGGVDKVASVSYLDYDAQYIASNGYGSAQKFLLDGFGSTPVAVPDQRIFDLVFHYAVRRRGGTPQDYFYITVASEDHPETFGVGETPILSPLCDDEWVYGHIAYAMLWPLPGDPPPGYYTDLWEAFRSLSMTIRSGSPAGEIDCTLLGACIHWGRNDQCPYCCCCCMCFNPCIEGSAFTVEVIDDNGSGPITTVHEMPSMDICLCYGTPEADEELPVGFCEWFRQTLGGPGTRPECNLTDAEQFQGYDGGGGAWYITSVLLQCGVLDGGGCCILDVGGHFTHTLPFAPFTTQIVTFHFTIHPDLIHCNSHLSRGSILYHGGGTVNIGGSDYTCGVPIGSTTVTDCSGLMSINCSGQL